MAAATNGGSPIVLGAVLIVGAMLWSRQRTAVAAVRPGQVNTMPGSAGTGAQQIAGGIIGALGNFLSRSGNTSNWSVWNPINPDDGQSYNAANPGQVIGTQDLVNGTIHDWYEGYNGTTIPTTTDIFESVTGAGGGSIIRNPDAYW